MVEGEIFIQIEDSVSGSEVKDMHEYLNIEKNKLDDSELHNIKNDNDQNYESNRHIEKHNWDGV